MEVPRELSPRLVTSNGSIKEKNQDPDVEKLGLESSKHVTPQPADHHHFHSMNALEILIETVSILRYNSRTFLAIAALLICPLSAVLLSNVLVDQSIAKKLTTRLLLVAKSSGLQLRPFIKQSCQKFSEMVVSVVTCFPLYITLSLLSKIAVVHSIDCTYSRKKFDLSKFYVILSTIWKRVVVTYLWMCMVIASCLTIFLVLIVSVSRAFAFIGFPPDMILYPALVVSLIFSIILANAIIICNNAIVISVLEDLSGPEALLRSSSLIKGQTQIGLLIFLGSTIGMALAEGLFEHRVKILSDGDGNSRKWEGPLLVVMYSFVVLIDQMMSAIFFFSCKSYRMETANAENKSGLEALTNASQSTDVS